MEARWGAWLQNWHTALAQGGRDPLEVSVAMKLVNPKYIAREWMLVQAYRRAIAGAGTTDPSLDPVNWVLASASPAGSNIYLANTFGAL